MHTAAIYKGHLFGTKTSLYIRAMYRGNAVHTISCHESEVDAKLLAMKNYLKAVNFTHYRDAGIGLRKPL